MQDLTPMSLTGSPRLAASDHAEATLASSSATVGSTQEGRRLRHFAGFDGLRAIAAVSVLLLHTAWDSGFTLRSPLGIYTSRLDIGVSVFFLISGFLLYRPFALAHLSGRPRPDTRRFWVRRLLRIVPAYWLALTVLTYGFHIVSMGAGWQGIVAHYGFLQIYLPPESFNGIPQAWSLSTEMSFYLFLPLFAMVVGRRGHGGRPQLRRELVAMAVLVAISYGFRWWALNIPYTTVRDGHLVALCSPHCLSDPLLSSLLVDWLPSYLDLFALGMVLAVASAWFGIRNREPRWTQHRLFPWVSWGIAAATFWGVSQLGIDRSPLYVISPALNIVRQALYGVFAFFLLLPAVFGPPEQGAIRRFLSSWPMMAVGTVSYGVYLWHMNLADLEMKWFHLKVQATPFWLVALPVLAMALAAASASYFLLEKPVLRLKGRIGWWRSIPPPAAAVGTGTGTATSSSAGAVPLTGRQDPRGEAPAPGPTLSGD